MKADIIPSIIAKDQKEFNRIYKKIKTFPVVHLDVMGGHFVNNLSMWFPFKLQKHRFEAHLMTTKPERFIGRHHDKFNKFIVHIETTKNPDDLIKFVKSKKRRIYLALNPETPISKIKKYLNKIDGVHIMTVHPGQYGAKFLPRTLNKIKQLRKLKPKLNIEVDGGITPETIGKVRKAGANQFVVGSYIQKHRNIKKAIAALKDKWQKY